jgi:hypothetical protein
MICFAFALQLPFAAGASELDLRALVRKVEQQYRGDSSAIELQMTIKTGHWQRKNNQTIRRSYLIRRLFAVGAVT